MLYTFKLYYKVNGANRRRSKTMIRGDACTLADAWEKALHLAIVITRDDEILDSIQLIEREE